MAKIGSRSALRDRRRSFLKSAKLKLRLGNLFIGILCVVALAFLYIQPFYSVQFSYAVSAEQLQQILSEQMGAESVSEEDLSGVELNLGVTLTMEGKGLSGLLVDELDALLRLGNAGAEENGSGDPSSGSSETAALSARTGAENDDTGNDGTGDDQSGTSAEDSSGSSSSGGDAEEGNGLLDSLLNACKENDAVQSTVSAAVDSLLEQAQAAVPKVVAVYVRVAVRQQVAGGGQSEDQSGGDQTGGGSAGETEEELPATGGDTSLAAAFAARHPYAQLLSGASGSSSSGSAPAVPELDVDELAAKIEELLSRETVTVADAQNAVMEYVKENQQELGLTDDDLAAVETQVGDALGSMAQNFGEQATDENGDPVVDENGDPVMVIRPEKVVTDILVQTGIVEESRVEDGAALSDILTEYIMDMAGETENILYYVFMAFSLVLAVLYLLWGILLIKSIVKIFTGTPMGAFFVKLITGLPFLLLVVVPTCAVWFVGMDAIVELIGSYAGGEIASALGGLSVAFSGGWVAFACTAALFLFGFLYSAFKREYKNARHAGA